MRVIPMGHVHANENAVNTVSREVREETGLDIEIDGLLGVYDDFQDDGNIHHEVVCYRTTALTDPPMVSREAKEYVLIGRRQVKGLKEPRVVRDMLSDYSRSRPLTLSG